MNVLITGASGFVGKRLCKMLLKHSCHVTAVTRASVNNLENANVVNKDIKPNTDWADTLNNINVVVHLANRAHVMKESADNPYLAYKLTNVDATLNLAKQAISAGVQRFIYISSIKVNGEFTDAQPFLETDQPKPEDDYGRSKCEAEEGLKALCHGTSMRLVIIRPPLIYGPDVKANFLSLIHLCNKPIPLPFGLINNKRSFVFIDNLNTFITLCLTHPKAEDETFLVSDNDDQSTACLIKSIKSALGKSATAIPVPKWMLMILFKLVNKTTLSDRLLGNLQVDTTKARTLLGWRPSYTFAEGIRLTVDSYKRENDKTF